jgi:DNA helicase-2/ATP-dependent DNA helicase PcrA
VSLSPEIHARLHAGLDPQQSRIVDHIDGPAMVVAGAGAGKTKTLVHRVANLVARGVDPSRILLLTFTKAAAASIVSRARRFEPAAERVVGGTFHSVAHRLIKENHAVFGLPPNFSMCDPGDVEDLFRRLMASEPMRNGPRASTVAKMVSFALNTRRGVADVVIDRYPKYADHADAIATLAERYSEHKKLHHILDFDDLLIFFSAMANDPQAGPVLRRRFRYVMIDEVQDCNALQVEICHGLGADGGNILVVGDPSQAIYGFRGSSPSIMFGFQDTWPTLATYLIETNYRSTPEIVEMAGRVDASMRERFTRRLSASKPSVDVKPSLVSLDDRPHEASWIAQEIMDRREEGLEYGEMAVLVRSMRNIRHVEIELAARGIPTVVKGGIRIHEAAHIKDVLAPLRIALNPLDEPAWIRLLSRYPKVGDKSAAKIASEVMYAGDVLDCANRLAEVALKKPALAGAVEVLRAAGSSPVPSVALANVVDKIEGLMRIVHEDEWEWRRRDVDALVDLASGQHGLDEFLSTLAIDVSIDKGRDGDFSPPDPDGVVTLATIHSSKGLEWHTVYVPSFVKGHIPSGFGDENDEDDDEERRLLYVMVTRAKTELVIVRPQLTTMGGDPVFAPPSPFEALIASGCRRIRPGREAPSFDPMAGFSGLSLRPR